MSVSESQNSQYVKIFAQNADPVQESIPEPEEVAQNTVSENEAVEPEEVAQNTVSENEAVEIDVGEYVEGSKPAREYIDPSTLYSSTGVEKALERAYEAVTAKNPQEPARNNPVYMSTGAEDAHSRVYGSLTLSSALNSAVSNMQKMLDNNSAESTTEEDIDGENDEKNDGEDDTSESSEDVYSSSESSEADALPAEWVDCLEECNAPGGDRRLVLGLVKSHLSVCSIVKDFLARKR